MITNSNPRPFARLVVHAAALAFLSTSIGAQAQADKPAASKSDSSDKLPPAREVIDRFIEVMGGKEAFRKVESQQAKGKFEMAAQGIKGDLEVFAKRPNKLLVKINIPGIGDVTTGFDGKVGWALNAATGPILMDGKQLEQMRDQADFDSVLHEEEDFKSMETVAKAEFEGKECYKLKLVKKSGQEMTEFYDVKNGLLAGSIVTQESPLGAVEVTNALGDYKKFGDIQFATKVVQKMGPLEQVMTIDSFELNKVDDSVFALPDQIKALANEKK